MKFLSRSLLCLSVLAWSGCSMFSMLGTPVPTHTLRFHEEAVGNGLPASRSEEVTIKRTGEKIKIDPYPTLSEQDIAKVDVKDTAMGDRLVLHFDSQGTDSLMEMSVRLRGRHFVIIVDHEPIAIVNCDDLLMDGQYELPVDLGPERTKGLVDSINKALDRHRDMGDTRFTP